MRIEPTPSRWPRWGSPWAVALAGLFLAIVAAVQFAPRPVDLCLLHRLTGYPCPTCGTTRLVLCVLHGRLLQAVAFNPLIFALLAWVGGQTILQIAFKRRVVLVTTRRRAFWLPIGLLVALLVNWLYLLWKLP